MKKLLFLICAYFFLVSFCDKPEIILTSTWRYAGGQYTPGDNIILDADNLKTSNYKISINYDVDIKNKDGDEAINLTVSVPDIFGVDTTKISKSNFRFISENINQNSLNVPTQNSINQASTKAVIDNVVFITMFLAKNNIDKGVFTAGVRPKDKKIDNIDLMNRKDLNVSSYKFVIDGKNQRKGFVEFTLNIPKDLKYSNMAFNIMATVEYNQENLICPDRTATETKKQVIQMPYNNDINPTQKE
jgi:hypothetical protein